MRGGAGVARWAHNPKVVGSNPAPATKRKAGSKDSVFLFLLSYVHRLRFILLKIQQTLHWI